MTKITFEPIKLARFESVPPVQSDIYNIRNNKGIIFSSKGVERERGRITPKRFGSDIERIVNYDVEKDEFFEISDKEFENLKMSNDILSLVFDGRSFVPEFNPPSDSYFFNLEEASKTIYAHNPLLIDVDIDSINKVLGLGYEISNKHGVDIGRFTADKIMEAGKPYANINKVFRLIDKKSFLKEILKESKANRKYDYYSKNQFLVGYAVPAFGGFTLRERKGHLEIKGLQAKTLVNKEKRYVSIPKVRYVY